MADAKVNDLRESGLVWGVANEMPGLPFVVISVSGPGFATQVRVRDDGTGWDDDDRTALEGLGETAQWKDRVWQIRNPAGASARRALQTEGYTVEGSDEPGAGGFHVTRAANWEGSGSPEYDEHAATIAELEALALTEAGFSPP